MSSLFEWSNEAHHALLARIRTHLPQLEALEQEMAQAEVTGLLRFYNSDPQVYDLRRLIQQAALLFRTIAAGGELSLQFEILLQDSSNSHFDLSSARLWIMCATPTLSAFFHCKFLVGQHVWACQESEHLPDSPPLGWVVLLRLYCLQ